MHHILYHYKYSEWSFKSDWVYIYPSSLHRQDVTQGQIFKQSKAGLNSEYPFS